MEDEAVLSIVLSNSIWNLGYNVKTAGTGEEAVEYAINNDPVDLILMDIDLGSGIDGAEAARRILKEKNVPVIFHTSHSDHDTLEKVRGITRYGYLVKNSSIYMLQSAIEMAFELFDLNNRPENIPETPSSIADTARSEEKYRLLFDNANESIVIVQEGKLRFMNRMTLKLLEGYTESELTERLFMDLVYTDDREMVIANYMKRISGEPVPNRYFFRIQKPGGIIKWVDVNVVLIEWDGKPATLNFVTDISELKNLEDRLKKTGHFALAILDALSTSIAILNSDGEIITVNRAWREFALNNSGNVSGLCEGNNYLEVCESSEGENSEEALKIAAGIRAVVTGSEEDFSAEYPCHSPDKKRWFIVRVTRFEFDGAVRIVAAHENITKRKQVEADLHSLSFVVEQSPVSIVITDQKGNIQYVNPAVEKTTGYSKHELLGQNPRVLKSDYIAPEEYKHLWETITSGEYWRGEFHNIRKDGSFYWESATISPIFDEMGEIVQFAGIKEEITERKQAGEKIKNLLKEKELLLQEVHHRIKNNMNTIRGLLYLQAADMKDSSAAVALHDAENRVQSMMLLYDKLYCSHDFREISVKSYLEPLVDEIIANFPNSRIVRVDKNISNFILDANIIFSLGIIVNELLSNIMKYAFSGRDSGIINVSASLNDNLVIISLSDNGNGIPDSIDFERSTGFGMQLVGMLTIQIGGNVRLERGNGTTFVLEFPVS